MNDATHVLSASEHGDAQAANQLLPLVYEELRRLAAHKMANEAAGHTLQPTALVHEAWLRLVGNEKVRREAGELGNQVPQGRPKIAHGFSRGWRRELRQSPVGATENCGGRVLSSLTGL